MWSDPGSPRPRLPLAVTLRALMWAIIGVLVGGTTAIVWLFSDTEPPRLVTVFGNVSPQIGAALFGGGYLVWARWRRRLTSQSPRAYAGRLRLGHSRGDLLSESGEPDRLRIRVRQVKGGRHCPPEHGRDLGQFTHRLASGVPTVHGYGVGCSSRAALRR